MATIDRIKLLTDVKKYLTEANILDDETLLELAEDVISEVGDDDTFYKEIRCKVLKRAAEVNQALSTTDLGRSVRREESYERVVEWFEGKDAVDYWEDYLKRLPKLCSALGYCGLNSRYGGMFKVNVATPIRVPAGNEEYGTVERFAKDNGKPITDEYDV